MDKYERIDKLGEGTYGVVWKAQNIETGQVVALKRIRLESEEEGVPCTAIREISLLKELDHPNIVRLLDIIHDLDKLTLVFEHCKQDLKQLLDARHGVLSPKQIQTFMYQLCKSVAFCHDNRVLHRDLKPQNLLIAEDGTLKLADFGLARAFSVPVRNYSHEVVTLWYRAPEVLLGYQNYSTPIDMWSVGCIFAEMRSGKALFPGKNTQDELIRIFRIRGTPTPDDYPGLVDLSGYSEEMPGYPKQNISKYVHGMGENELDLLEHLLDYDPSKRPSASECLQHIYLNELLEQDPNPPKLRPPKKF